MAEDVNGQEPPDRPDRRRLGLTLDLDEYERVVAYARQLGRPIATAAKRVLLGVIDGYDADAIAATLTRERDRVRDLEAEVTRMQAQLTQRQFVADLGDKLPHWRWPLEPLLADRTWWDEWLPLLGELVGRDLEYDRTYGGRDAEPVVDERGFANLMRYLFPDVTDERGVAVTWHSPEYGRHARRAWQNAGARSPLHRRPVRAEVWEPVVRHVARALTALETTSQDPADAYTHLRVEAEIRGEWMRTLGVMLGTGSGAIKRPEQLPREPLP
jgi:hypothetical protein